MKKHKGNFKNTMETPDEQRIRENVNLDVRYTISGYNQCNTSTNQLYTSKRLQEDHRHLCTRPCPKQTQQLRLRQNGSNIEKAEMNSSILRSSLLSLNMCLIYLFKFLFIMHFCETAVHILGTEALLTDSKSPSLESLATLNLNQHQHHHHNHGISSSTGGIGRSNSSVLPSVINTVGVGANVGFDSLGASVGLNPNFLENMERSVAAVLIKVAYGTTSTTKRSIPDNSYVPSQTTIATPPLTTLRYLEKSQNQEQINIHHRNYELDLERDHALPTSAPNADILKSNTNTIYPNPNRHRNNDRDRLRHVLNSTPSPIHNLKKGQPPTVPMFSGDMPSYSPPARAFFTPPLPPEYQNPFADKPTLRGTNNDGGTVNTNAFINRRPIPPPSLTPGHERIPFRPPDLNTNPNADSSPNLGGPSRSGGGEAPPYSDTISRPTTVQAKNPGSPGIGQGKHSPTQTEQENQRKKALNTPSHHKLGAGNNKIESSNIGNTGGTLNVGAIGNVRPLSANETLSNTGKLHPPNISRILSGSNGRKEDIPEVLLRTITARPDFRQPAAEEVSVGRPEAGQSGKNPNINQSKNAYNGGNSDDMVAIAELDEDSDTDDVDIFVQEAHNHDHEETEEPKTQPKIKAKSSSTSIPGDLGVYSTQLFHNFENVNGQEKNILPTTPALPDIKRGSGDSSSSTSSSSSSSSSSSAASGSSSSGNSQTTGAATWTVAWNIHVYLSAILFTVLAVYSIFKMIFYDKLTHLFNQSYFITINLILIFICLMRIFYLCYDAYNIHASFHLFISEVLLNLPATFLTISFSVLILFLLIRSLNHKNNRYSALIRPLTVVVGSSVHVGLCITLHYVESYTSHTQQMYYQHQLQQQYQIYRSRNAAAVNHNHLLLQSSQSLPPTPPRVLSLICQIIYIFVCLSLGLLYLYIYRILKRVLRSKSQNYIHGYQNLSYAIHITIATALLFVLLAALQIYGTISISSTRGPLITLQSEIDWLQWGYQFSLRLIEIAIITLMSWVTGLKTGGNSGVIQRGGAEKSSGPHHGHSDGSSHDRHNVSGFALFPCTSSSSQEHFETDYPAVCNANTNLHTYTLRTGKPLYDDNFALNSLGGSSNMPEQQQPHTNDCVYETNSLRSAASSGTMNTNYPHHQQQSALHSHGHSHHSAAAGQNFNDFLADSQTDHYENPNFELRNTTKSINSGGDNCYSEPVNSHLVGNRSLYSCGGYDFQNFEKPTFEQRSNRQQQQMNCEMSGKSSTSKSKKNSDRLNYDNPDRRSSNLTYSSGRIYNNNYNPYNSFERSARSSGGSGVRKSGTLNNIGGGSGSGGHYHSHARINGGSGGGGGGASSSSGGSSGSTASTSTHPNRPSGVQTLSSTHLLHNRTTPSLGHMKHATNAAAPAAFNSKFYRNAGNRVSLEKSSSAAIIQQPNNVPNDDCLPVLERTNLLGRGSVNTTLSNSNSLDLPTSITCTSNNSNCDSTIIADGNNIGVGHSVTPPPIISTSAASSDNSSANSGSMLVAEHGFVRFRALDDMNNAQGVGIHNASIRNNGESKHRGLSSSGVLNNSISSNCKDKQRFNT